MQSVVKFLFSSLQKFPFNILKNFGDYGEFYVADVRDTYCGSGQNRSYKDFEPVEGQNGINIFFNKETTEILHIGAAGNRGGVTGFYAVPSTGIVPQLINGITTTILNHFQKNVQPKTSQGFDDYINEYSVFFLCLKPSKTNPASFAHGLDDLVDALKLLLKPTIQ